MPDTDIDRAITGTGDTHISDSGDQKKKARRPHKRRGASQQQRRRSDHSASKTAKQHEETGSNSASKRRSQPQSARSFKGRQSPPFIAAIDLGTNNCRLLIAHASHRQSLPYSKQKERQKSSALLGGANLRITDAFSRIVRLGEGLASTGVLSDAAMERTITALKICSKKIAKSRPLRLDAVATEACRRAKNGEAFLRRVKDETGIALRIISGNEEAELALKSCVPLIDLNCEIALVFDIGGGSTEVSVVNIHHLQQTLGNSHKRKNNTYCGQDKAQKPKEPQSLADVIDSESVPVGVVTFSERTTASKDQKAAYQEMRQEVKEQFSALAQRHNLKEKADQGKLCVIGTGGTITTLKALHLGLRKYNRSQVDATILQTDALKKVITDLAAMTAEQRAANGCIGQGRADLVLPGCSILEGMLDLWPVQHIGVADRGLREGLLVTMLNDLNKQRPRGRRGGSKRKKGRKPHAHTAAH